MIPCEMQFATLVPVCVSVLVFPVLCEAAPDRAAQTPARGVVVQSRWQGGGAVWEGSTDSV